MRIAFASFVEWSFSTESPYRDPTGGSESALCYLAEALAAQGHEVFILNRSPQSELSRGVHCWPLSPISIEWLQSLDAFVVQNLAGQGKLIRPHLGARTRLILWTQHAHDQPAVQALDDMEERHSYDGIAVVSQWQRACYAARFGIAPECMEVLRNAAGPAFCDPALSDSLLSQKAQSQLLAYTSTPFRGLDVLLEVFPLIRAAIPDARLKVFSSLRVYHVAEIEDESQYGWLYRQCRTSDGVEYVGSLPQPELARQLRSVSVLAYPNTFAETSCISALEAMASGCWVVTSDLGALPETMAGFGTLVPIAGGVDDRYKRCFVESVVEVLQAGALRTVGPQLTVRRLREQIDYVQSASNWPAAARAWVEWLQHLAQ